MPEFPPGTPLWVDLASPDTDESAAFYSGLFGWEAGEPGPVEETSGYRMFTLDGRAVAGLIPIMSEGVPPSWTSYFSVADAEATATAVKAAGGGVVVEPMDVHALGRMAIFADPAGAVFGVWQPGSFRGADLVGEPGSLTWNEVITTDLASAKAFYPAVFGWEAGRGPEEIPDEYVVWMLGGRPVGGAMQFNQYMPEGIPPYWGVCFAVADADATVARAQALGAAVDMPVTGMSVGRFAVLRDPHGAGFSIMEPAQA